MENSMLRACNTYKKFNIKIPKERNDIPFIIAYNLWIYGEREVYHTYHFLCEKKVVENIIVNENSIVCHPNINVSINTPKLKYKGPLLWTLIKYHKIFFSGCAGKGYAQLSVNKEYTDTIRKIVDSFNSIKNFHDKKNTINRN